MSRIFLALCVLLLSLTPAAAQETQRRGLVPSVGLTSMSATGVTGATVGIRAGLLHARSNGVGFDFGIGYFIPSRVSEPFSRYSAIATDIGLAYQRPLGAPHLLLSAGGSFLLNSNGSGGVGPHVKLGVSRPLGDQFGIRLDFVAQYWLDSPGFGAGADVALEWRQEPVLRARSATTARSLDSWMVGANASLVASSHENWDVTFRGPGAAVARIVTGGVGFETALVFIMPAGRYDFTGASLDLGLAYGLPAGQSALLLPRVGVTALIGGDSDGTGGGAGAIYAGAGFLQRITGRLAFRLNLTPRVWVLENATITFGGSAGLVFVL